MDKERQQRKGRAGAYAPTGVACKSDVLRSRQPKLTTISSCPNRNLLCATEPKIDRLRRALATVAELVVIDRAYIPIFIRLEKEIVAEEAKPQNGALARAQALIRQNAIGLSAA